MSDLSQEARALIDSVATLDDPGPADRARVKQRLTLVLGVGAFGTAAASGQIAGGTGAGWFSSAKAGLFGTTGKLALCASVLGGVLGGALVIAWPSGQPAPRQLAHRPAPALEARGSRREQNLDARTQAPATPAQVAPPAPASEQPAPAAGESAPPPGAPASQPARARVHLETHRAARASATAVGATEQPGANAASSLTQELALLAAAQAALRAADPAQALALAQQHQQRFPAGVLREERLGVQALAECGLDRKDAQYAAAFLRSAPSSPLAARVRKACGLE